jgi:hypothetical protein
LVRVGAGVSLGSAVAVAVLLGDGSGVSLAIMTICAVPVACGAVFAASA